MTEHNSALYDAFAHDLDRTGYACQHGFSIRLVRSGHDNEPAYEKTINGSQEIIVGLTLIY